MAKKKKKKRLRLNYKGIFKLTISILFLVLIILYFVKLRIKNIYIEGTSSIRDVEIIEAAGIKEYPEIFKLNTLKMKKKIKELPLVKDVKIKRNIFGKITFIIEEDKVLFYSNQEGKYITSSGKRIDNNGNYKGCPTLINQTPEKIINKLITGFNKVDDNILKMINTIEYNPYVDSNGTIIDETRFKLVMNDYNTVMIDTVNIRKLNDYFDIYVSLNMQQTKGLLYLDTITDDNILFESYTSIEQAQIEKDIQAKEEAAEEHQEASTEHQEENN